MELAERGCARPRQPVTRGKERDGAVQGNCPSVVRAVTSDGRVVGEHPGIEQFTIGQRKGLGVGLGEPYYVVRIETESRQVVIGSREELGRLQLTADRTNWLVPVPEGSFRCQAQIRYNSVAQSATAEVLSEGQLMIDFDEPVEGVAAGQAVVCYQGEQVMGGGWIC